MVRMRLIIDGERDGAFNMALDEAMLILRSVNAIPNTLRLYIFKPSTVTIGYFQSLSEVVNLDYVKNNHIPVIRRPTGGGAVYHDEFGEITYSVVISEELVPKDFEESFRVITEGVVRAIKYLGVPAEFKPLNDVVINGKKVSGQAQLRRLGTVLQHGTLMYATSLDTLCNALTPPKNKLRSKGITSIRERVTTLSEYLGRKVSREEVINAMIKGFSEALNAEFIKTTLTEVEITLAKSLRWKYLSSDWNYLRP